MVDVKRARNYMYATSPWKLLVRLFMKTKRTFMVTRPLFSTTKFPRRQRALHIAPLMWILCASCTNQHNHAITRK